MRIVASPIIQLDRMIGPVYFPLQPGAFIQGLLAAIERVYVVTIPNAAEYAERWPEWPRIAFRP